MQDTFFWLVLCVTAAALALVMRRYRGRRKEDAGRGENGERPLSEVDGSTAFTGRHNGLEYWVNFEGEKVIFEVELGGSAAGPFVSDRNSGPPILPGDGRDAGIKRLFGLGAVRVEAGKDSDLLAAQFPQRVFRGTAGDAGSPRPAQDAAETIVECLADIRGESARGVAGKERV